jgi:uncharacterized protein
MSTAGFDQVALKEVLSANLTPSDYIRTPERLFGRDKYLTAIERSLSSPGRQIFIYGDRGVGKTSLASTAAFLHTQSDLTPIHINCGRENGFFQVVQAIGNSALPPEAKFETRGARPSGGINFPGIGGANFSAGGVITKQIPLPTSLNDAFDIVRYLAHSTSNKPIVVVIDEMERIVNNDEKDKFAEFIKNLSTVTDTIKFIFCGIASDLTELLGAHPSASRILEPIELKSISHDALWRIIQAPAEKLGIDIDRDKLIRIGQLSDGFPHYVHLIGECLFWAMFDDASAVSQVNDDHYGSSIRGALQRTEAVLRNQYNMATKKTKNTEDYEEALWALADKTSDRRQLTNIYEVSYSKIMLNRRDRNKLTKEKLNQRLLSLRKDSHGKIVIGHGSGWFSFRENIMRGYVRLDAETKGIPIGIE